LFYDDNVHEFGELTQKGPLRRSRLFISRSPILVPSESPYMTSYL